MLTKLYLENYFHFDRSIDKSIRKILHTTLVKTYIIRKEEFPWRGGTKKKRKKKNTPSACWIQPVASLGDKSEKEKEREYRSFWQTAINTPSLLPTHPEGEKISHFPSSFVRQRGRLSNKNHSHFLPRQFSLDKEKKTTNNNATSQPNCIRCFISREFIDKLIMITW